MSAKRGNGNRWRQHHRSDGIPKTQYRSRREAQGFAYGDKQPYRCLSCRGWHLGADKSRVSPTGLGERVDRALTMENLQQPSQRRKYIVRVARKAEHIRDGTAVDLVMASRSVEVSGTAEGAQT